MDKEYYYLNLNFWISKGLKIYYNNNKIFTVNIRNSLNFLILPKHD